MGMRIGNISLTLISDNALPMKRTLFIALLFLLSFPSFGQKIHFSDSTNVWHCMYDGGDPYYSGVSVYNYIGDTIIHDTAYKILNSNIYIREDTLLRKVFVIGNSPYQIAVDTTEQILYDYTLQIGDTFKTTYVSHIVANMDSVVINGIWHKTWYLVPDSTTTYGDFGARDYYVIEGIGCLDEPTFPIFPFEFEYESGLLCFSNNSSTPLVAPKVDYYFDNASSCHLETKRVTKKSSSAAIIPNPISETSKIVFSYSIPSGSVVVVNDMGQVVVNTTFQNKDEVLIGDEINMPGIYLYRVVDDKSGSVFSGKFVKY